MSDQPDTSLRPDADAFRAVLGRFATGVTVMTTDDGGHPHGMTANAVSSVSLDPLLVLVCVDRAALMAGHVQAAGVFALSFLGVGQAALSDQFADPGRPEGVEQFAGVPTVVATTGAPVLADNAGWLDCRVWDVHDGGDHLIVVGEVVALGEGNLDEPLVYHRGVYGRFQGP